MVQQKLGFQHRVFAFADRSWQATGVQEMSSFVVVAYAFETALDLRQHRVLGGSSLPPVLEGVVSREKFERARAYGLDKSRFHFLHAAVSFGEDLAVLSLKVLPWVWGVRATPLPCLPSSSASALASSCSSSPSASASASAPISGGLLQKWGYSPNSEILQTLLFLTIWSIANQAKCPGFFQILVLDMPGGSQQSSEYAVQAREKELIAMPGHKSPCILEHTISTQTPWGFVKDMVLELALTALLGPPIIAAIITIVDVRAPTLSLVKVQYGGPYLALYLWLFLLAMSLVFMALYPVVIAPLFNKFTPLKEGSLRTEIEALAQSLSFPLKKLYVVDGSTRSSHSNAYMYGFYNSKRIVLYDTLIQQSRDLRTAGRAGTSELRGGSWDWRGGRQDLKLLQNAPLGHWKLSHTTLSFFSTQVLLLLQLGGYTYVRNNADLFRSFGFSQQPILIGLILFQ
eukprot:jgi/Mesen1/10118/ME000075S09626